MEARKKIILAFSLALLWGGLAAWQWYSLEEPQRVPLVNVTGPPSSSRQAASIGTSWRVNLGLLTSAGVEREAGFATPRNIFAVPGSDGSLPLIQDQALENSQDLVSDETARQHLETAESVSYRYLGYLRVGETHQKNKNIAVLKKGDDVMVLKVGDRVDDHMILRAITAENVIIRDTETKAEQTVLLSETAETGVEQTAVSSDTLEMVGQE